ncbi:MAG: transporter [Proteobacteria bacterium]|nr:transporter [Pseudomonadota bacterium]
MHALPYWRLSGYYFFHFAFIGAFLPFFGLYLQSIGFSAWDIGLLMSLMNVMRLFSPSIWGWLADRSGCRVPIIRLAGLMGLTGFSIFFYLRGFTGMMLVMGLLSFFWSAALPLVEALTFSHLREASTHYSRIRLWGSIGFVLAVLGTGALLDYLPINTVLTVCWLFMAGNFGLALSLPEALPAPEKKGQLALVGLLRQSRVKSLFAASFAMSAAHGAFYIFFSIHLAAHGYGQGQVGVLWTLGVVAEILVFLAMARLNRIFSLRAILFACFLAAILRFLLTGWCAGWLSLLVLAQLLHGLTFGAHHAASIAAVNRWFAGRAQARGQALYSSISFGAGSLFGGLVSGWMWDAAGADWTFGISALFALAGLLLIVFGVPADSSETGTAPAQMR